MLVSKLDRLGRSLLVIVDAHDRLDGAGATLRSGREPMDTSNPFQKAHLPDARQLRGV